VKSCLDQDTAGILRKLLLATMATLGVVPVYVLRVALGSIRSTDNALHLDIVGPVFEVALCVVGWLRSVDLLADEPGKGRRTSDRDGYGGYQLCASLTGFGDIHIPIVHSSIVHNMSHLGSGGVTLPASSTPTNTTRIVAKAIHTKPLMNITKMPIFFPRGIWRRQVRRKGRNMTKFLSVLDPTGTG
jgi:hypothetical protein